jgi:cell division protein FtsB
MKSFELQVKNRTLERDNIILKAENGTYSRRIESLEKQIQELHNVLASFGPAK